MDHRPRRMRAVKTHDEEQKKQTAKYLLKNMHQQQNMLNGPSQYTSDFDPYTQEWYFSSLEDRSTNLEHMYRTIVRFTVNNRKEVSVEELKIALSAIMRLYRRADDKLTIALPHWILAALCMLMTRMSIVFPSWKGHDEFTKILCEKNQRGCQTFLYILLQGLNSESYLYQQEKGHVWIIGTGLVPLPKEFLEQVIAFVQRIFVNDKVIKEICEEILLILRDLSLI